MSSPPPDRSVDSLFDSFDTPPRPPHASGSSSSAFIGVAPPAPSRAGYGRVVPSRSTATTVTSTNRRIRRNRDGATPARSSSSSSSSSPNSDFGVEVNPSSSTTRHPGPSSTNTTDAQPSSPPNQHIMTGHNPYEGTYRNDYDDDEDHDESGSFRNIPDSSSSRSGDDDDEDQPESEESESELSILHKIGLVPDPNTISNISRSNKPRGGDDRDPMDGVDEGFRTSWMGPSEVRGMRMGPRLTDRGVGFEGVDHQTHRTIIEHQLASTSFLFSPGPYLDRARTTNTSLSSSSVHTSAFGSGRVGSRMDGRKGLRVGGVGDWMGGGSGLGVGAGGRFGVGVLPRGG